MSKLGWSTKACGIFLLWATAAVALPAQTFTTLHSFAGTDGNGPYAGLVQGTNGGLYGTTHVGGANSDGTVFKITLNGTLTSLHSFDVTDGYGPYAGLIQGTNGSFYGTTSIGGASDYGTVFKITPSGVLTTLHSFDGLHGINSVAGLVQAANGNFYGTTFDGGAGGIGTVFQITPSGVLTTLYSFCSQTNCADGEYPDAGLVQATDGNFYGTTYQGGAAGGACTNPNGCGTVFKITASGRLTTLYSFCSQSNCTDGDFPAAGLVQATDGNFYGTTYSGGANQQDGTVFQITSSGALTTLHSFNGTDGYGPQAGLVQATDGKFYGTTYEGGAGGLGTVFKITASGMLTTLHSFGNTDGAYPYAAVVQDTNGKFYGTTYEGGANNDGTVFSLSVGLGAFVETQPTSGSVGEAVKILGTNLTGATSVSFNGTPQPTFTVVSASEITTTVPTGATTGTVQVVTSTGATLSSNLPFTVRP